MAHHTIRVQWFGSTWLTKQYKYNDLNVRGSPNATYTMVWGTHGSPNDTNTMVWWPAAHQTFVHNGLGTHDSPNLPNTLVWYPMAHQALHIPWCGGELVTKPYKYISLNIHGSPNVTYPKFCDTWIIKPYKYNCFQVFHCFPNVPRFPCCPSFTSVPGFSGVPFSEDFLVFH